MNALECIYEFLDPLAQFLNSENHIIKSENHIIESKNQKIELENQKIELENQKIESNNQTFKSEKREEIEKITTFICENYSPLLVEHPLPLKEIRRQVISMQSQFQDPISEEADENLAINLLISLSLIFGKMPKKQISKLVDQPLLAQLLKQV